MFKRLPSILILPILCGCAPGGAGRVRGIESSSASFTRHNENPIPGLDEGSIAVITLLAGPPEGVPFVIWSDVSGNGHGGGNSTGAYYAWEGRTENGRAVTIAVETTDGVSGTITIDGRPYDFTQGALFLISTQNGGTTVRQVEFVVEGFPTDLEALQTIADANPAIGDFFRDAVQTEPEDSELKLQPAEDDER